MKTVKKNTSSSIPEGFLQEIHKIVGKNGVITNLSDMAPYLEETRGIFVGSSPAIIRPKDTLQVSKIVAMCFKENIGIVPQGGNTGLCGGSVASGELIVNLERMNEIRSIDAINYTITVDAGCILSDLQKISEENDRFFPLSLGAEGSCQIGGNLSTNAGGTSVLRYGNARELALGLEVVLSDGRIWNGLTGLRKDNTGYDLKQLFIGAEGTLGIITGAVLKLFPLPLERQTVFVANKDLKSILKLLSLARNCSGDTVSAFEFIPRIGIDLSLKHIPETVDPLKDKHEWYTLIEFESGSSESGLDTIMEMFLNEALINNLIIDGVIAQSEEQRHKLWFIREAMVLAQKPEGASIKNDISVPISKIPEFILRADKAVKKICPGIRLIAFGHIGDGIVHYNLQQPLDLEEESFMSLREDLNRLIMDIVQSLGGSFSAEHGIGILKVPQMISYKTKIELELMKLVKDTLDPNNILNPGKIL